MVCYRLVLRRLGYTMMRHDVDDEQLLQRITGETEGGPVRVLTLVTRHVGTDHVSTMIVVMVMRVLMRSLFPMICGGQAKVVLRKLGVSKHDIAVRRTDLSHLMRLHLSS